MPSKLPEPPELQYGEHFNKAVCRRLEEHFAAAVKEVGAAKGVDAAEGVGIAASRALVVGLMGEWGSGKTLHLKHIQQDFEDRLQSHFSEEQSQGEQKEILTVPVFFNAWRFEAEEHLIIPLLKTTQQRLQQLADEQKKADMVKREDGASVWIKELGKAAMAKAAMTPACDLIPLPKTTRQRLQRLADEQKREDSAWIKAKAKKLGKAAAALAYGLKGQFNFPGGSLELDLAKVIDEFRDQEQTQQEFIDGLSSLYFDFETWIEGLTKPDDDEGGGLNLLFLIDDLDRCLPEKAVRMLESIKLFLDVRGCAFVLALDGEVVERGIAWRYRDYGPSQGEKDRPANPITGHEYLEKIVQVPMRIPAPAEDQIKEYLIAYFGPLFDSLKAGVEDSAAKDQDPEGEEKDVAKKRGTDAAEKSTGTENETRHLLRTLIRQAVPPVPRKLNRVGELYGLYLEAARENGWRMEDRTERLTQLRLTILQLLAPDLYRFGRRNPVFLAKLEDWKTPGGTDLDQIEKDIKNRIEANEKKPDEDPKAVGATEDIYSLKHLDQPLLELVRSARRQRSGFDPLRLVDTERPSADRLERFFRLDNRTRGTAFGLGDLNSFLSQLFSTDKLAWRNALEQEALKGRVLDQSSFNALLKRVRAAPESIGVDWLELIAPHLNADQLFDIYKASRLLTRLAQGASVESA